MVDAGRDDEPIKTLGISTNDFLIWADRAVWCLLNHRSYPDFVFMSNQDKEMAGIHVLKDVEEYMFMMPDGRIVNCFAYNGKMLRIQVRNFSTDQNRFSLKGVSV